MTVREIQGHLRELYAVDVLRRVYQPRTDALLDELLDGRTGRSMRSIR